MDFKGRVTTNFDRFRGKYRTRKDLNILTKIFFCTPLNDFGNGLILFFRHIFTPFRYFVQFSALPSPNTGSIEIFTRSIGTDKVQTSYEFQTVSIICFILLLINREIRNIRNTNVYRRFTVAYERNARGTSNRGSETTTHPKQRPTPARAAPIRRRVRSFIISRRNRLVSRSRPKRVKTKTRAIRRVKSRVW